MVGRMGLARRALTSARQGRYGSVRCGCRLRGSQKLGEIAPIDSPYACLRPKVDGVTAHHAGMHVPHMQRHLACPASGSVAAARGHLSRRPVHTGHARRQACLRHSQPAHEDGLGRLLEGLQYAGHKGRQEEQKDLLVIARPQRRPGYQLAGGLLVKGTPAALLRNRGGGPAAIWRACCGWGGASAACTAACGISTEASASAAAAAAAGVLCCCRCRCHPACPSILPCRYADRAAEPSRPPQKTGEVLGGHSLDSISENSTVMTSFSVAIAMQMTDC